MRPLSAGVLAAVVTVREMFGCWQKKGSRKKAQQSPIDKDLADDGTVDVRKR